MVVASLIFELRKTSLALFAELKKLNKKWFFQYFVNLQIEEGIKVMNFQIMICIASSICKLNKI